MPKGIYIRSEENCKNISLSKIGSTPWNKGLKSVQVAWNKGKTMSEESRLRLSHSRIGKKYPHLKGWVNKISGKNHPMFGKHHSDETKKKISLIHKGKKISEETKLKISEANKGINNWNWKGGISSENEKIRHSLESKLWKDSVKNRDGNLCSKCGEGSVKYLTVHHILNFSSHIELRFAIDNGITFCIPCHKEFHRKYGTKNNSREQVLEFIKTINKI